MDSKDYPKSSKIRAAGGQGSDLYDLEVFGGAFFFVVFSGSAKNRPNIQTNHIFRCQNPKPWYLFVGSMECAVLQERSAAPSGDEAC